MKILYFTNIFPHYRLAIWKELLKSKDFSIEIFYSKSKFQEIEGVSIKDEIDINNQNRLHNLKNYKLFGHIFWQSKTLIKSIFSDYHAIFLLGDMKLITNWIIPLIARLRNKKIVYWTHGIYGNESQLKKKTRLLFLSLSHEILVYEKNAKKLLIEYGFNSRNLHVVYNSLNYDYQKSLFKELSSQKVIKSGIKRIIFIGRLTKVKKLDMLIKVIKNLNQHKLNYKLTLIGDGPEKDRLKLLSKEGIQKNYIIFLGSIYNEEKIAKELYGSDLCVAPGNIGLTCIHSLTYGTPVCTHSNVINQMPEFEAIKDGVNGILFKEDDMDDLKLKIKNWFEKYDQKNTKLSIRKVVDEDYNPYNQIRIINNMIDKWQK